MRRVALFLIVAALGGPAIIAVQNTDLPTPAASPRGDVRQPRLRIIPEAAIFAPGQRFDVRIEADEIEGPPRQFSFEVNGRDEKQAVFGTQEFVMNPPIATPGRPTPGPSGGVTGRNWSLGRPGRYVVSATLTQPGGRLLTAKTTVDIANLQPTPNRAKNIILFIGDGMGVAQRTAARIASKGIVAGKAQGLLEMDQMEANGFVMTSSLDSLITDSSPGAAALATGNKSLNNWHGVFPDNTGPIVGNALALDRSPEAARPYLDNPRVENIAEFLQRTHRMSTGIVTNVAVTDSTPGSFSSHTIRYAQNAIAEQMLQSGHSVILGAGARFFLPVGNPLLKNIPSARIDGRNLVEDFKKAGYTFVSTSTQLEAGGRTQKLLGLFHGVEMASRYDRMQAKNGINASKEAVGQFPDQPNLEIMTQHAINVLSQNPNGFFLMVEGGSIDREYHRLDPSRGVYETIELDKAIGVARAWSRQRGNEETLIIVTADHETSGVAIMGVSANGRPGGRTFPTYEDANHDGFPDSMQPDLSLAFDFPTAANPTKDRFFDLPRNLKELNPTTTLTPPSGGTGGHTAVDIFIAARGPGANLFGTVMDNTDVFFRMLRALGER